ncbi:hypothetical protein K7X08_000473 [Anisodus acutangulus]|uniref:Uncharacterized protein n=1 Tax=Anisodus acutangulus TaxID=402998 RepID=A0A9Q1M4E2_9SOLA|nr:hypothetical protein K7X08_000473 [Anisodus acutangulus]
MKEKKISPCFVLLKLILKAMNLTRYTCQDRTCVTYHKFLEDMACNHDPAFVEKPLLIFSDHKFLKDTICDRSIVEIFIFQHLNAEVRHRCEMDLVYPCERLLHTNHIDATLR